jgi:hypothetical protein
MWDPIDLGSILHWQTFQREKHGQNYWLFGLRIQKVIILFNRLDADKFKEQFEDAKKHNNELEEKEANK